MEKLTPSAAALELQAQKLLVAMGGEAYCRCVDEKAGSGSLLQVQGYLSSKCTTSVPSWNEVGLVSSRGSRLDRCLQSCEMQFAEGCKIRRSSPSRACSMPGQIVRSDLESQVCCTTMRRCPRTTGECPAT